MAPQAKDETSHRHFDRANIPAPFLIRDELHQTYTRPPLLLCGSGNLEFGRRVQKALVEKICERNDVMHDLSDLLAKDMCDEPTSRFPDSHGQVVIKPGCTQRQVFILQNTYPEPDSKLFEVFQMADAARRAGASDITAILPYYAYGRGDRKTRPREPISASLVANLLTTSGVNRIITEDIHAEQTTGSILNPWDNLYASAIFIPELKGMIQPKNTVVMAADAGGLTRAKAYKKRLGAIGTAFVMKNRDLDETSSKPESLFFAGNVEGREVVIVDDETVSFSSINNAVNEAVKHGAVKIIIVISHLKYAKQNTEHAAMLKKMRNMPPEVEAILTTDSVALPSKITDLPTVKVIDTAPFWAEIIWRTTFGVQLSPDLID